ncbi:MAG: DUF2993 domain-containing protein [Cyanobacteria bacterium]|nr:DUF2993 domain-containing protein [Cyanobacteriota bacterium]MDA0867224.1 DUF2993 domain-containing protein [Cyanobacteriota bacterium]
MIGGLPGFANSKQGDMGERMLNSVATQSIRHLFTRCGDLDVEIRCSPPSKLLQGTIDSFKMQGKDLVIRREFETAEMTFETDAVAIDLGALLGGNIKLKQPTQAISYVVLMEDAINRAFEAELVKPRLQNLEDPALTCLSGGDPVSFRDVSVTLLPHQQVRVSAVTDLPNRSDVPLQLKATLAVKKRRRLVFDDASVELEGIPMDVQPLSRLLTEALIEVLNAMIDLDRFNLDGITLRLNRLETQGKKLIFSGYAQIDHFPKGG